MVPFGALCAPIPSSAYVTSGVGGKAGIFAYRSRAIRRSAHARPRGRCRRLLPGIRYAEYTGVAFSFPLA